MSTVILIGLVILMILAIVALSYKSRAQQAEHYAALQKTISDAALSQIRQRTDLDQSLSTLETRQRQETIDETTTQHLVARTDLDNDWSAASGLHGNSAATTNDNHGIAAAGSTGITSD